MSEETQKYSGTDKLRQVYEFRFRNSDVRNIEMRGYIAKTVAEQTRKLRGNYSLSEFSKRFGVSVGMIQSLEHATDMDLPTLKAMVRLAKAFDVAIVAHFVDYPTMLEAYDNPRVSFIRPQAFDEAHFTAYLHGPTRPALLRLDQ